MTTKFNKIKILLKTFFDWRRKNKKKLLFSAIHALLLLIACYGLWNSPYTFSSESDFIKLFNITQNVSAGNNSLPDSLLLVNVSYDRQLIDCSDEWGVAVGNTDITDRQKLLELFGYLAQDSSYRYIVCDVFFDASLTTEYDDSLFTLMAQMPRLVVPMHTDGKPLPSQLANKAAYANYKTNFVEDNFLKFQYLQDGKASIPLFIWKDLTSNSITSHGFWYAINGNLATNSIVLDFQTQMQNSYHEDGSKDYLNLGVELLEILREENTKDYFQDKIVLIGDLTERDIHSTIAGTMPGVLINYNAYLMLCQNKLVLSGWLFFWLWLLFTGMTYLTVSKIKIIDILEQKGILKNDILKLMLSFVEYSGILYIFNLWIYCYFLRFIGIFVISSYFAVIFKIGVELYNMKFSKKIKGWLHKIIKLVIK
ncbi:MAG: CHASE2 domain-containing protein [Prevotella sp.]|jgi:hypothetical protein|nr:CHASE2 domain-containing protein [Prevotella sp.]